MGLFHPILLGIAGGLIGIVPFIIVRRRIKSRLKNEGNGSFVAAFAAIIASFILMLLVIIIWSLFFKETTPLFAIVVVITFLLGIGVYTATLLRR